MTVPITLIPRNDSVEGMQFDGSHTSASDIAAWLHKETKDKPAGRRLAMNFTSGLNTANEFNVYVGGDSYELLAGDWIIKDGNLFSKVRREDFPFRYVTAIEKILLEAGMN